MQLEAFPSSVLRVVLEPGDELVDALKRALQPHPSAFVVAGAGEVEDAELLVLQISGRGRTHQKLSGAADLVSLTAIAGEQGLEVRATLASQSEAGSQVIGGLLVRATVVSADFRAVIRETSTTKTAGPVTAATREPVTSSPVASAPPAPSVTPTPATPPPSPPSSPSVSPQPSPREAVPSPGATSEPRTVSTPGGPPLPPKLRRTEHLELFPEENDVVTHFAFGRCVVIFSDGERIRFQQERDGRVREVALSMLRIDEPTVGEDGKRHWELRRKN